MLGGVAAPASGGSPKVPNNNASYKKFDQNSASSTKRDEQREFILRFIQRYIDEGAGTANGRGGYTPISRSEQLEMESVLYSVSFGKQEINKKVTYQAFSAAISS